MTYRAEYLWIDGTEPTAEIRSKTKILADGELLLGQKFTPGEKRFDGFIEFFRNSCDIDESGFHLFVTLTTEETLRFPIDKFLKDNFKILIHPKSYK